MSIQSKSTPAHWDEREDLPGAPRPAAGWYLDPVLLAEQVAAMAKDSTDPWIGLEPGRWGYTFETCTNYRFAMQRACNDFDVEAWRAQQRPESNTASAVKMLRRDELAWRTFCEAVAGRLVPVGERHKRLEGFTHRVLDTPKPINPSQHPEGYVHVEDRMAVMVVSVERSDGERRWCVVFCERRNLWCGTSAMMKHIGAAYGRTVFRKGMVSVWEMVERLVTDWPDEQGDEALDAAKTWVREMRASLDIPTYDNEVPMDPGDLYHAQVVAEDGGLSEARVILAVTE